jgi:hypothetical protein
MATSETEAPPERHRCILQYVMAPWEVAYFSGRGTVHSGVALKRAVAEGAVHAVPLKMGTVYDGQEAVEHMMGLPRRVTYDGQPVALPALAVRTECWLDEVMGLSELHDALLVQAPGQRAWSKSNLETAFNSRHPARPPLVRLKTGVALVGPAWIAYLRSARDRRRSHTSDLVQAAQAAACES